MNLTVASLTFDCTDAGSLAHFWSEVLGVPVDPDGTASFASIGQSGPTRPSWLFVQVPEGKMAKNRFHVDLSSHDWPGDVERIVDLGATLLGEHDELGTKWATLADPEGNEFDIVAGDH
jgi:hypothetical protein